MKRAGRQAYRAALTVALLVLLVTGVALVLVPRLMGWVPLTVLSGSMGPAYPAGSQVVVAPVAGEADAAALRIGDTITFMPFPGDPTLVTHRIVDKVISGDGTVSFGTRGDANAAADPWHVGVRQIRGHVLYHVPYAGYLANLMDAGEKRTGATLVAVAMFGYAAVLAVRAVRAVRHARRRPAGRRAAGPASSA